MKRTTPTKKEGNKKISNTKIINYKDNKKAKVLTLIGLSTLLLITFGATYAYFLAAESNGTSTATLDVTTNETASVVATGNTTLTMDLNLDDMRKFGETKTYYATKTGKSETPTIENFINVESSSSTDIYCTYTAQLTKNDTEGYSNMIDQIIANGKEEELYLEFLYEGTVMNSFDMKTAKWTDNKIQFTGILRDIQPSEKVSLDARMYLKNLSDVDQAPYLAHSALNLNMQLTKVNCDTADTPMITSLSVLSPNDSAIEVTLEEGGYELASYCIDQVERSDGECDNWITNNDKTFTASLNQFNIVEDGTYYIHVKDIRGYIADSAGFDVAMSTLSEGEVTSFDNTGNIQSFTPTRQYYKLEVWGSQGTSGGVGGYSVGVYDAAQESSTIYVVVGNTSGYNGGGRATSYGYMGGGATHMALETGILSSLSSTENRAKVLIVAGGGGSYDACGYGGSAGGGYAAGGNQTSGAAFGQGSNNAYGGGGGGWYGGYGSYCGTSTGGSGYIGNNLLISTDTITKQMYCYSCSASNEANIKTTSVSTSNSVATANTPKAGNGYAKITALGSNYKITLY